MVWSVAIELVCEGEATQVKVPAVGAEGGVDVLVVFFGEDEAVIARLDFDGLEGVFNVSELVVAVL